MLYFTFESTTFRVLPILRAPQRLKHACLFIHVTMGHDYSLQPNGRSYRIGGIVLQAQTPVNPLPPSLLTSLPVD